MQEDFYLDTSIWLDFYEKRGKNGESALKLILKIINEDLKVSYSDLHVRELKKLNYSPNEINSIFSIAKPKNLQHVHIYREQKEDAKNIARKRNIPEGDVLHAILCRDNNLQLISRDNDFLRLTDISEVKLPEDFI
ncbi:PIN domain-containing protein [Candidatus Woesearchaeota archaeon]|nr:PIN domain-containing protein [Candidatus Woesearchaeota archaeon]